MIRHTIQKDLSKKDKESKKILIETLSKLLEDVNYKMIENIKIDFEKITIIYYED